MSCKQAPCAEGQGHCIYIDGSATDPTDETLITAAWAVYHGEGDPRNRGHRILTVRPTVNRAETAALLAAMRDAKGGEDIFSDAKGVVNNFHKYKDQDTLPRKAKNYDLWTIIMEQHQSIKHGHKKSMCTGLKPTPLMKYLNTSGIPWTDTSEATCTRTKWPSILRQNLNKRKLPNNKLS